MMNSNVVNSFSLYTFITLALKVFSICGFLNILTVVLIRCIAVQYCMAVFTLYVGCYIEAHYTTTDLYTVVEI